MDLASLLVAALLGQTPAPAPSANKPAPPSAGAVDKASPSKPASIKGTTDQGETASDADAVDSSNHAPAQLEGIHEESGPQGNAATPPTTTAADDGLAPVRTAAPPPGAADSLMHWLTSEDQVALEGKPTPLADLLARLADRGQQIALVQTYWKLSAALGEYRIAADESARLGQLLPPVDATGKHPTDPLLESRLASCEARLREAELAVVDLQYALGESVRAAPTEPLVLPVDLPHVGAYRTYFQERYARVSPPRGHLIDRSLPLLHRSLELRASAAVSAADAADADQEAYHAGKLDGLSVIETLAELTRQRRAFVAAVRDYNSDIAEYALSVVPPGLSSAQLVNVLIGPPKQSDDATGQKAVVQDPPPVKRAGYDQPIEPGSGPSAAPGLLRQGGAADATGMRPLHPNSSSPTPGGTRPRKRIKSYVPKPADSKRAQNHRSAFWGAVLLCADTRQAGKLDLHIAAKPPLDDVGQTEAAASDAGLYSALAALEPPQRLRQLSDSLQWDRASELSGDGTTLPEALTAAPDRRAVLAAYWQGRERIAAYQVRQQQHDQLLALQAAALHQRQQPNAAEAMLRLQTAQFAAEAGAVETQVAVLAAQFDLAQAMRRPLSGRWPLPTTPPHAGHFRLKLETQPASVVEAMPVRQLARDIPTRYEALLKRAEAVVAADAARAEISQRCDSGEPLLDPAIAVTAQTAEESLSLLADQTQYNVRFAEYVLAVAPPTLPAQELAGLLVVSASPSTVSH